VAILDVLREANYPFRRHLEIFDRGIDDDVWLQLPGIMGWLVLTKDKDQRYQPLEKEQLITYCIREFAFSSGNLNATQMSQLLKRHLRKIDRLGGGHPPPFVASITATGVHLRQLSRRVPK